MGRPIGMICILAGCGGLLYSWHEKKRRQQVFMGECIRLFARWEYALEKEHMRLCDFLEAYDYRSPEMEELFWQMKGLLERNCYPSGNEVWQELLRKNRGLILLEDEAYQIFFDAGDGFFGNSRQEALRCIKVCRERMEQALAEQKRETARRWRVYMPVGMLGGMLLIILLV